MRCVSDASRCLNVKPYDVFVQAYKHLGLDGKVATKEALESWERYRASGEQKADTEVIDYCICVLDPRAKVQVSQA